MGSSLPPCPHCGETHPEDVLKCPKTDALLDLEGRRLAAKFRLVARLGTGGMAEVWLARNELVDKDVAIKLIRPDIAKDEEMLARFRNEAKAAGRIGNPHICEILDLGQSAIGPFIVMELLVGESLASVLAGGATLAPDVAAAIARQALEGLEAAHRAGIVHRDLKPENLFLHAPEGSPPMVKIMDFGVSKFLDGTGEAETAHGILLGTPQYMAPEQVRGARNVDPRTDVWAMGAILYRALAGRDAFKGETMAASLLKIASEAPPPLADLAPEAPAGLVRIVQRCLERDPKARYPSAEALRKALEPFARPGPLPTGLAQGNQPPEAAPTVAQSEIQPTVPRPAEAVSPPSAQGGRRWLAGAFAGLVALGAAAWIYWGATGRSSGEAQAQATSPETKAGQAEETETAASVPTRVEPRRKKSAGPRLAEELPAPSAVAATGGRELPDVVEASTGTAPSDTGTAPSEASGGAAPSAGTGGQPGSPVDGGDDPVHDERPSPAPAPSAPSPPPAGTVRIGDYLVPAERPGRMTHAEARAHCRALDERRHLGLSGWRLLPLSAVPAIPDAKGLPTGRFWTAANWKGKGKVVSLPSGRTDSASVSRKFRPLCAVKRP